MYNNAASNSEPLLGAAPDEAAAVWPPTTQNENYSS